MTPIVLRLVKHWLMTHWKPHRYKRIIEFLLLFIWLKNMCYLLNEATFLSPVWNGIIIRNKSRCVFPKIETRRRHLWCFGGGKPISKSANLICEKIITSARPWIAVRQFKIVSGPFGIWSLSSEQLSKLGNISGIQSYKHDWIHLQKRRQGAIRCMLGPNPCFSHSVLDASYWVQDPLQDYREFPFLIKNSPWRCGRNVLIMCFLRVSMIP